MRLSSFAPSLAANVFSSLHDCGIRTETDLLFSNTAVDIFRKLPPGTMSLHELKDYTALVTERASAFCARADKLLNSGCGDDLVTGVAALDELFGGIGGSQVLEISGDKGSGKTTLALHIVLRYLSMHPRSHAFWVDTTGGFSAERLVQILQLYDEQAPSTALDRFQVSLAFDIDVAHEFLENLRTTLSVDSSETSLRYIVIDSITPLLGPLLSAVSSQGHAIMTTFMRQLRALAQSYSLTILVINNATISPPNNPHSVFATTVKKPALGPSFTFLTDTTLWLAHILNNELDPGDEATVYTAEVLRTRIAVRILPQISVSLDDLPHAYLQQSKTWCFFKMRRGLLLFS